MNPTPFTGDIFKSFPTANLPQTTSTVVANPFLLSNNPSSSSTGNQFLKPFNAGFSNPFGGGLPLTENTQKSNEPKPAIIPLTGVAGNTEKDRESKPAFNPFTQPSQKEDQKSQKEENAFNPFGKPNTNPTQVNPIVQPPSTQSQVNQENSKKEENQIVFEKKPESQGLNSDNSVISNKNPFGALSQIPFGPTSTTEVKSNAKAISIPTEKSELNNQPDNSNSNKANIINILKEGEKQVPTLKQTEPSSINGSNPIINNKDKEKEKETNSSLNATFNDLPNAKIEDTFIKWKNDLEYQSEKYTSCCERLKNYELQFESEIESISLLTNLIQSIQVNSDETVAQLKEISSKEDELLSQLNFLEQSLQSFPQDTSSISKDKDSLFDEITDISKKINNIGSTIDSINQRCEPNDSSNSLNSKNPSEEGEMNKMLNEFYSELRRIEFAEQALLSKLNYVESDIKNRKVEFALKKTNHL